VAKIFIKYLGESNKVVYISIDKVLKGA